LEKYCADCEFVFHLAGVNRPKDPGEFYSGNLDFSSLLLNLLRKNNNSCPILVSSSVQAELDNDYGKSKKMAEELFLQNIENPALIFRLYGVFGKWSRPSYNTVVATFMYNVIHDLPVKISDPNKELTLCYIDDVIEKFVSVLEDRDDFSSGFYQVDTLHKITLGQLYDLIVKFNDSRKTLVMPSLNTLLKQRLYGMFLSYLDMDKFSYKLDKKRDNRGFLAEFIKSADMGQIFVSTTRPGVTRGNHWHHTKAEKFFVIKGEALINFRNILTNEKISYKVSGDTPRVVDIPVGYTHNIKNIGDEDMVCLFWSSEIFDSENPDTYYCEV
jgi:UDP-2-acetamido-2,6-beta-L-arabino-hexul-4-ose reductase